MVHGGAPHGAWGLVVPTHRPMVHGGANSQTPWCMGIGGANPQIWLGDANPQIGGANPQIPWLGGTNPQIPWLGGANWGWVVRAQASV